VRDARSAPIPATLPLQASAAPGGSHPASIPEAPGGRLEDAIRGRAARRSRSPRSSLPLPAAESGNRESLPPTSPRFATPPSTRGSEPAGHASKRSAGKPASSRAINSEPGAPPRPKASGTSRQDSSRRRSARSTWPPASTAKRRTSRARRGSSGSGSPPHPHSARAPPPIESRVLGRRTP
jgi:hypothetical protein